MRWALLVLLLPAFASAQVGTGLGTLGDLSTGPRILGEPAFAFEADLLSQAEASRSAFPVTTTRASTATCANGYVAQVNEPCLGLRGLEAYASGNGGRAAGDRHVVSSVGWPTSSFRIYLSVFSTGTAGRILDAQTGSGAPNPALVIASGGSVSFAAGGVTIQSGPLTWPAEGGWKEIVVDRGSGSNVSLLVEGQLVARAAMPVLDWGSIAYLGQRGYSNSIFLNGGIRTLRISAGAGVGTLLTAIGDSITRGTPYAMTPYPARVQAARGPTFLVQNEGVGGDTTAMMLSRWTATIRARKSDVVVLLGGVNDINTGVATETTYANLVQMKNEAIADGARVLILTVAPCSTSSLCAGKQAQVDALNALIRGTTGVTVIDAYASMGDTSDPTKLRPAYDSGDGVHPNDAGAAAIADLVLGAL